MIYIYMYVCMYIYITWPARRHRPTGETRSAEAYAGGSGSRPGQ